MFVGDDLDSDKEITKQSLVYYIINNSIRIYGKVSDIKGNQCTIELDGYQRESINTVVKNKDELFVRPNHESILKLKENKKLNEEEKEQLRKYLGIDNSNFKDLLFEKDLESIFIWNDRINGDDTNQTVKMKISRYCYYLLDDDDYSPSNNIYTYYYNTHYYISKHNHMGLLLL